MRQALNKPRIGAANLSETQLAPALVSAYRRTDYRVGTLFTLRVDQYSACLSDWQRGHGVDCSAFLGAVNPRSQLVDEADNQARHEALRQRLEHRALAFVEAAGMDPDQRWPEEAAFLIAGLTLRDACRWGRELDQNALLWSAADATPRLVLLR